MRNEELLQSILDAYDSLPYPKAFLAEYDIMECLDFTSGSAADATLWSPLGLSMDGPGRGHKGPAALE